MRRVRSQFLGSVWRLLSAVVLGVVGAFLVASPVLAAAPAVSDQVPVWVKQTEARLSASVDPNTQATSYHFEIGKSPSSFDIQIPADHDLVVGSGDDPVTVTASPKDLDPASQYYFRVVASNNSATVNGPAQPFETLNEEGLAGSRRWELLTGGKGPFGLAAEPIAINGGEMLWQAHPGGNSLMFAIANGTPDATSSSEIAYRADRGDEGWSLTEVSPSLIDAPNYLGGGSNSQYGRANWWLASDMGCAFSTSAFPLTDDPGAKAVLEAGGFNLYRRNGDGSYDLVTYLDPTNPQVAVNHFVHDGYKMFGASENCDRVFFETNLRYPGVPFVVSKTASKGLYEWHDGVLSSPTTIPGPSGPEAAARAYVGATTNTTASQQNAVSTGGRLFFTAVSKLGGDLGRQAVFVRKPGDTVATDASQSQTATANNGNSLYQIASRDGSQVFFIARYGLAQNGSSTGATTCDSTATGDNLNLGVGCDLYRYSVDTGVLTDLSASSNVDDTAGAGAGGVLDVSDDGSRVYFIAKGQLVAGKGQTYAQNINAATRGYNVYLWDQGAISYVTTVPHVNVTGPQIGNAGLVPTIQNSGSSWGSRATADGGHLLFQTTANPLGLVGGNGMQAYRYAAGTDELVCVSCRRDGLASIGSVFNPLLPVGGYTNATHPEQEMTDDGSRIIFRSDDALTPDAPDNGRAVYEWHERQINLLASGDTSESWPAQLLGASSDGSTIFVRSRQPLVPWDVDGGLNDVYAARVGGGFDPPPGPGEQCDPLSDGSCQGERPDSPGTNAPRTGTGGDGNVSPQVRRTLSVAGPSAAARRRAAASGVVRLRVSSNRAGLVSVVARGVIGGRSRLIARGSARVSGARSKTVALRLSGAAKRRLRNGRALRLSIDVRSAGARERSLTVRLPGGRS